MNKASGLRQFGAQPGVRSKYEIANCFFRRTLGESTQDQFDRSLDGDTAGICFQRLRKEKACSTAVNATAPTQTRDRNSDGESHCDSERPNFNFDLEHRKRRQRHIARGES
jgi:hypothetical protein